MDKPNYLLLNNNKPAECFLEVYRGDYISTTTNQEDAKKWNYTIEIDEIRNLKKQLAKTVRLGLITIAIFKIRLK
jgi:hypothetical protein